MAVPPTGYDDFFRIQNEVSEMLPRALDGILSAENITFPQAFTLKALNEQGDTCRMSDLAAIRSHTPAAMTGIIDRLIHLGLVRRSSDAADRRVILIELTAQGRAVSVRIEKMVQGMMQRFFESVPLKDRETMMRMFIGLKEFLKGEIDAHRKS
jgi:DNA-binding MarR family transcriptional regulator